MNTTTLIWIVFLAMIPLLVAIVLVFASRCRKCRRWFALKHTGRLKLTGRSSLSEYRCRYCGYEIWKEHGGGGTTNSPPFGG